MTKRTNLDFNLGRVVEEAVVVGALGVVAHPEVRVQGTCACTWEVTPFSVRAAVESDGFYCMIEPRSSNK